MTICWLYGTNLASMNIHQAHVSPRVSVIAKQTNTDLLSISQLTAVLAQNHHEQMYLEHNYLYNAQRIIYIFYIVK
jgi:hypothetical protein